MFLKLQRRNIFVFMTSVNTGFLYPVKETALSCLSKAAIKCHSVHVRPGYCQGLNNVINTSFGFNEFKVLNTSLLIYVYTLFNYSCYNYHKL